ncbi:uncharacterized protein LOC105185187 isoform X1 [Harpegnathos saltator]|uniref:uncharacterized protein LOC105185187 isoform X1 n=1 Tax=Harpegnathos saltator TaxID=610380 RepID=UPI000DBEF0B5|nr:uncharacterized protein LOC105185187 isoform X1 [Harpegnathos saltator]
MLSRWFCAFLLILAIQDIIADTGHDVSKYNMAYYNLSPRLGLRAELENTGRRPSAKARTSYRGLECNCINLMCSCCTDPSITDIFNHHVCTNITYNPENSDIKLAIIMDRKKIYTNSFSAKDPPPICVPPARFRFVNFCVRLFDINMTKSNLYVCIDFETRVMDWPILILHFNCFKIGANGLSWTKPEDGSNVFQALTEVSGPEIYDDVDFENAPMFPNN